MKKLFFFMAVAGISLFYSCEKEEVETLEQPESTTLKFSLESMPSVPSDSSVYTAVHAYITQLESSMNDKLAIPIKALNAFKDVEPGVASGRNATTWSADISHGGTSYKAVLTGIAAGSSINWTLEVSAGTNASFIYVTGVSNGDLTSIEWKVKNGMNDETVFAKINFNEPSGGAIDYTYEILVDSYAYKSISLGYNSSIPYDAYLNVSSNNTSYVVVKWNRLSGKGTVQSNAIAGNDENYCWDSDGRSANCD